MVSTTFTDLDSPASLEGRQRDVEHRKEDPRHRPRTRQSVQKTAVEAPDATLGQKPVYAVRDRSLRSCPRRLRLHIDMGMSTICIYACAFGALTCIHKEVARVVLVCEAERVLWRVDLIAVFVSVFRISICVRHV